MQKKLTWPCSQRKKPRDLFWILRLTKKSKMVTILNTKEFISEEVSLPVEERAFVVDSLLRSFNQPESYIDNKWCIVAKQRLIEMRNGSVKTIQGEEVFEKIWQRFNK